jgi:DNA-binding Xre family transcriptional regulator
MAQRWSINEDIIICQNCIKYPGAYSKRGYVEHLAHLLQEAGYEPRSIRSIQHRAYAFETVRSGRFQEGRQLPYASEQVVEVYKVLSDEKVSKHEEIAACIRELYNPDEETKVELTNLNPNNTIGYQCAVDTKKTFPVMLQRLLDLRGIKRHQDLCDILGMSINTFNAIIRGKYTNVKKDSVLQICIGLELCTMQAEELLDSAGFSLSYGKMKDVVIRACIQHRQYNPIAINRELRDHGVKEKDLLYPQGHPFHRP